MTYNEVSTAIDDLEEANVIHKAKRGVELLVRLRGDNSDEAKVLRDRVLVELLGINIEKEEK